MYYENHRGTYTTQAFIKRNNRKGEILLARAEMASVFAGAAAGHLYNKSAIEEGWKLLLKNQFHDTLPGTSIHEAHEDCRGDYNRMNDLGEVVKAGALEAINAQIATDSNAVVVWNLLSHTVSAPVEVEMDCEAGTPFMMWAVSCRGKHTKRTAAPYCVLLRRMYRQWVIKFLNRGKKAPPCQALP